jgi:hypothetical protein
MLTQHRLVVCLSAGLVWGYVHLAPTSYGYEDNVPLLTRIPVLRSLLCMNFVAAGSEVDYQALTGYVSKVPKDATAVGHMRDGHFVIIVRGTKETTDRELQVTSAAGENMPAHALACPANDDDVMAGNVNASRAVQKLSEYVPEVRSYINFRDTGEARGKTSWQCC